MNIFALDIGGTSIKYGLFENEELVFRRETPTNASSGGEVLFETIVKLIKGNSADAIGISTAGQVNADSGEIIFATDTLPGWKGMKLKKRLEAMLSVPVAVENDGNAAALGEAHYGNGKGYQNLVCLVYGTGIGGGLILGGELYRGHTGSAGELGHIELEPGGRRCMCGGKGCYEAYASTSALVSQIKQYVKADFEWDSFFAAVKAGSLPEALIYKRWIEYVVAGLKSIIHALNPACVLLGGGIMERHFIIDDVNRMVKATIMDSLRNVLILPMKLGNSAGLYGAMYSAVREYRKQKDFDIS